MKVTKQLSSPEKFYAVNGTDFTHDMIEVLE